MTTKQTKRNRAMLTTDDGRRGYTRSASRENVHHVTRICDDGRIDCTCEDARYRHPGQRIDSNRYNQCKHARLICAALRDWHRQYTEVA